jgi:hypothetical protein
VHAEVVRVGRNLTAVGVRRSRHRSRDRSRIGPVWPRARPPATVGRSGQVVSIVGPRKRRKREWAGGKRKGEWAGLEMNFLFLRF